MSFTESPDEDSLPSAQRQDFIPATQEELLYETEADYSATSYASDHDSSTDDRELSDPPDPYRPNRVRADHFRRQITHEQEVSNSLEGTRARDLAIHLYNTFRLHERAKRLRTQSTEKIWEPPRSWTAWPHPAENVPRERELERHTDTRAWTYGGSSNKSSREVLEEILIATASHRAREDFARRLSVSDLDAAETTSLSIDSPNIKALNKSGIDAASPNSSEPQTWKAELPTKVRRPSTVRSHDADSTERMDEIADSGMQASGRTLSKDIKQRRISDTSGLASSQPDSSQEPLSSPGVSIAQPITTFKVEEAELYPGPLTDEDQVRSLLKSPARHTLAMFDELLTAMHHSRASHVRQPRKGFGKKIEPPPVSFGNATTESIRRADELARIGHFKYYEFGNLRTWDWSSILGFAAVAGWDEDVIQRARARCERLFGQRMDFVTFGGGLEAASTEDHPQVTAIPSTQDTSMAEADTESTSRTTTTGKQAVEPRLPSDISTGHDPMLEDGLHVDGFLQLIEIPKYWSGLRNPELPRWWKKPARMTRTPKPRSKPDAEGNISMADSDESTEPAPAPGPVDPSLAAIDPELIAMGGTRPAAVSTTSNGHDSDGDDDNSNGRPAAPEKDGLSEPPDDDSQGFSAAAPQEALVPQPPAPPKRKRQSRQPSANPRPPKAPRPPRVPKPEKPKRAFVPTLQLPLSRRLAPKPGYIPVEGPPAPFILKRTRKLARTPEELDMWRARGYVPHDKEGNILP